MSSEIAIRVEGLGKQYRIGQAPAYGTFRDALSSLKQLPFRLFKRNGSTNGADRFWALKDVSFEVKRGEVVGIIGRNGAGKSTLLKILSRITEPTEGGADIYGRVGSLLEVGTGFHPELTGRENIFLNGAILGMRRAEILKKFSEIVAFAEVEQFIDTPVKHFSSGMYMRLAFAVAAHLEPEILVVDEVLAVGDATFQKKCMGKMEEVAGAGRTILFVSHNMSAIGELCSQCLLLRDGTTQQFGPTDRVIRSYLSVPRDWNGTISFDSCERDATFLNLVLTDPANNPSTTFALNEPIVIRTQVEIRSRIRGLEAAIALFNGRGDRLFYHSSAYATTPILLDSPGKFELDVVIPPSFLLPGHYYLNLALHIPNQQVFDLREHVAPFEVEDTTSGRHDFQPHVCGAVFVDLPWTLRQIAA